MEALNMKEIIYICFCVCVCVCVCVKKANVCVLRKDALLEHTWNIELDTDMQPDSNIVIWAFAAQISSVSEEKRLFHW